MTKFRLIALGIAASVSLPACVAPNTGPTSAVLDPNLSRTLPRNNASPVKVGVVQTSEPLQRTEYNNAASANSTPLSASQPQVSDVTPAPKPQPKPAPKPEVSDNDSRPASEPSNSRDNLAEKKKENEALASLYDKAAAAVGSGNLGQAASSLEQALRIDPNNAGTWHDLGQVRMHQKQYDQTIAMAQKSISFAGGNNSLKARNWRLIAAALKAKGDTAGAAEASAKAAALK